MYILKVENTSVEALKALVFGIIIPVIIYKFAGLEWMYGYMVLGAMFYNFVLRESTPVAYLLIIEAVVIVGFYVVLAIILFFGAVFSAFGG